MTTVFFYFIFLKSLLDLGRVLGGRCIAVQCSECGQLALRPDLARPARPGPARPDWDRRCVTSGLGTELRQRTEN